MSCCSSRRQILRLSLLAAALPLLDVPRAGAGPPVVATDLEVVTVTDTSVVLTWSTFAGDVGAPVDTEVRLAPADAGGPARTVHVDTIRTPYHYAEIHGLEPGRRYRFEAYSHGVRATPGVNAVTRAPGTPETTGEFTTLVPPPGRLLRVLALANDLHVGEEISGLLLGNFPPGSCRQEPGLPPYPDVMVDAMLSDLRRPDRGARHLIIAGDLTAEAARADTTAVRSRLDAWGTLGDDYFVARGNHDRPHDGIDHWGESFLPRQQLRVHLLGEVRLIGLDTTLPDGAGGDIDLPQLDHLRRVLAAEPDRPTVVFGHHPVTFESATSNLGGPGFVLNRPDADALQQLYTRAPGVFLQHSGHTHRNRRTRPDAAQRVEFLEVAAVKEYPGGYTLLRLYEGGYMVNFYKTRIDLARRWSARTRGQYFGLQPDYTLGTLADRNHVALRDLTGI